uniref:Uncharacterized protein n=1 Tax=Catagonus wagneri TaxID=51154 RepID=A0A8C3YL72_9CETA
MSSKVSCHTPHKAVREVLHGNQSKRWKFLGTVELQISLKNYDPQKDKRFWGTIRLKSTPLPVLGIISINHLPPLKNLKKKDKKR